MQKVEMKLDLNTKSTYVNTTLGLGVDDHCGLCSDLSMFPRWHELMTLGSDLKQKLIFLPNLLNNFTTKVRIVNIESLQVSTKFRIW